MNIRQQIIVAMAAEYEGMRDLVTVSPSALAFRVFQKFNAGQEVSEAD